MNIREIREAPINLREGLFKRILLWDMSVKGRLRFHPRNTALLLVRVWPATFWYGSFKSIRLWKVVIFDQMIQFLEKSQKRFLARKGDFILVLIGSPKWYISYILLIFLAQIFRISRKKLSHLSWFSIFPAWATPNFRPRIVKSDGGLAFFVRLYYDVKYRVEKWLFSAF